MRIAMTATWMIGMAAAALAQDFQVGARAKGMGGSYTSFDEDPVAIWLNPAGIAGAPSRLAVDYQTFTQYELEDTGITLGSVGQPQYGLLDPPIVPSFLGLTIPIDAGEKWQHEVGVAMVRPFQNRLTYLNGAVRVQTEQQFSRFRGAWASKWIRNPEGGFFHSVAGGAGLDVAFTAYEENDNAGAVDRGDTDTQFGFGLGLLAGIYTNQNNLSIDLGAAYQSGINFAFQIDDQFFPVWDWPAMLSVGITVKLLNRMDLRATFDVQMIFWDRATKNDVTGARQDFQDSTNFSFGLEYYLRVNETVRVLPRAGFRLYDAPWDDKNLLPAIGNNVLAIDTGDDRFMIFTFGGSIQWTTEEKVRSFDLGIEAGGDSPNFSFGYRHDF
jgi:hypothetical protein